MNIFKSSWFGQTQNQAPHELTSIKSKAVADWLHSIPKDNILSASDLFNNALSFLQQSILAMQVPGKSSKQDSTAEEWLNNAESIRPEIETLCVQLRNRYVSEEGSSPTQRRSIMTQILTLQMGLGKLYYELSLHALFKSRQQQQALVIQRALFHFTEVLYYALLVFSPAPKTLWQFIYALYQETENSHLQDIYVSDPLQARGLTLTVNDNLKIPFLLACANPHELHPIDLTALFHFLPQWVKHVLLNTSTLDNDLYCFALNTDTGPRCHGLHSVDEHTSYTRSVNLAALVAYLNNHPSQNTREINLIKHLSTIWDKMPSRDIPREPKTGSPHAVIGLSAIHYFLNGNNPYNKSIRKRRAESLDEITGFSFHISKSESETPEASAIPVSTKEHYVHHWHLVNSNEKGYCLCTTESYPRFIEPGELIAIQESSQKDNLYWHIGSIHWITNTDGKIQIGIQLISPTCTAVVLQNGEQQQNASHTAALFLPPIATSGQEHSVVLPIMPHRSGEKVRMVNQQIDADILLGEEIEVTPFYKRFAFKIVGSDNKAL